MSLIAYDAALCIVNKESLQMLMAIRGCCLIDFRTVRKLILAPDVGLWLQRAGR